MEPSSDFIIDRMAGPLQVVFQDEHYVAVFKPAGLMVHRGPRTLPDEPILLQVLRDQLNTFLYPVHRLDRPTAGLVLFGLSSEAASRLGILFQERRVTKHYQALVRGYMPDVVTADMPLSDQVDGWLDSGDERGAVAGMRGGDPEQPSRTLEAKTHFQTLKRWEVGWTNDCFPTSRFSLLEVQPITGRWHQIRRHLNHLAHPIIGDHRHGDHRWNQRFYQETGVYRMLLTAMRVDFHHPFHGEWTTICGGRGESFDRAIESLIAMGNIP